MVSAGSGRRRALLEDAMSATTCRVCGGWVGSDVPHTCLDDSEPRVPCFECDGTGFTPGLTREDDRFGCDRCHGSGEVYVCDTPEQAPNQGGGYGRNRNQAESDENGADDATP